MSIARMLPAVLLLLLGAWVPGAAAVVHHDLRITLLPEEHRFTAVDTVTLPPDRPDELFFRLHDNLEPQPLTPGVQLEASGRLEPAGIVYRLRGLPAGQARITLRYGGRLHHEFRTRGQEYARGIQETMGQIAPEGVYLDGGSGWYPDFGGLLNFSLTVRLPEGWTAISQGSRSGRKAGETTWEIAGPQEQIFLVAGEFTEYSRPAGEAEAMVFLRRPEPGLAEKYLAATARYLQMYSSLIGPYPYTKFALVENFWETGFGMPSFTLLGPKVIRFPFILVSSYPHEILHNWWGNSVYPAPGAGNWAEGLTAYLADHLLKEQSGEAAAYRQETLQKYTDYVSTEKDFPLTAFTARHSSATEAVGYGKALMFFHMLRRQLGDDAFTRGLREFYRRFRYGFASYADLQRTFEEISGRSLAALFTQWVERAGAPRLVLENATWREENGRYLLRAVLRQLQPGAPFRLEVPVAVTLEGEENARWQVVAMEEGRQEIELALAARPLRLDVDPSYDLFRKLGREEIPPALTQVFGAREVVAVLPGAAAGEKLAAWRTFVEALGQAGPEKMTVVLDHELERLPAGKTVVLLGWKNRFRDRLAAAAAGYGLRLTTGQVEVAGETLAAADRSLVIAARHPDSPDQVLAWVAADPATALEGLARKLPHYHKYSYLAFRGAEPENILKGRWPVLASPMTVFLAEGRPAMGRLPEREPLASLPPVFSEARMLETIRHLAGPELEGRGFGSAGLAQAAEYIAGEFAAIGLEPAGEAPGSYFQPFAAQGGEPVAAAALRNVIGVIPGLDPALAGQSVVVGAHYDHLGRGWPDVRQGNEGKIHPGASDNASGVAVLLELARVLKEELRPARTIVFAAFSGEEAGRLGSRHFVAHYRRFPPRQAIGMLNLDTVGNLEDKPLLVLGADSAREWPHIFQGAGYVAGVAVRTVGEELDASDQQSFLAAGIPAVQLFSGPRPTYHQPGDILETIDAAGLPKVAAVAREAITYLAERREPLAAAAPGPEKGHSPEPSAARRRVSLGTVPDFAYTGEGYRLSGVAAGSPAAAAGLREGDVIVGLAGRPVKGLREVSAILKGLAPGETVTVQYLREGEERTVPVKLMER